MEVVLADDHAIIRDGLVPFIARLAPDVSVLEAADFGEALANCERASSLGLIILDLYMPGMNDVWGVATMRRRFPGVPVVILSGSAAREDALRVISHGAAGFIPKTIRGSAILDILRLVLDGERYVPPFLFTQSNGRAGASAAASIGTTPLASLSPREKDILALLMEGHPNKLIARKLKVEEVTIKAHLRSLFRKLDVGNRTEAARLGFEWGFPYQPVPGGGSSRPGGGADKPA